MTIFEYQLQVSAALPAPLKDQATGRSRSEMKIATNDMQFDKVRSLRIYYVSKNASVDYCIL